MNQYLIVETFLIYFFKQLINFKIISAIRKSLIYFNSNDKSLKPPYDCVHDSVEPKTDCFQAAFEICWKNAHIRVNDLYHRDIPKYLKNILEKSTQNCNMCFGNVENWIIYV
ncbi:hypothetical protein HZS_2134 [Henneguya salminicola]|nr:hypothetical protein HZS_2134 [Henneguya salminicola]